MNLKLLTSIFLFFKSGKKNGGGVERGGEIWISILSWNFIKHLSFVSLLLLLLIEFLFPFFPFSHPEGGSLVHTHT